MPPRSGTRTTRARDAVRRVSATTTHTPSGQLRGALVGLPATAGGRALRALGELTRSAPVEDSDYDAIRAMAYIAQATLDFV